MPKPESDCRRKAADCVPACFAVPVPTRGAWRFRCTSPDLRTPGAETTEKIRPRKPLSSSACWNPPLPAVCSAGAVLPDSAREAGRGSRPFAACSRVRDLLPPNFRRFVRRRKSFGRRLKPPGGRERLVALDCLKSGFAVRLDSGEDRFRLHRGAYGEIHRLRSFLRFGRSLEPSSPAELRPTCPAQGECVQPTSGPPPPAKPFGKKGRPGRQERSVPPRKRQPASSGRSSGP